MSLKDNLINKLYHPQVKYWNKRLIDISERNIVHYTSLDPSFVADECFVSIFYDGITLDLLSVEIDDDNPIKSHYCLELFTDDKDLGKDCEIVTREILRLKQERYEAERFIAGFCMFEPPPSTVLEVFGDRLGHLCLEDIKLLEWELYDPIGFKTFVEDNQDIITSMQERILLNMITV
jgi:hypothetical protein